jgi:hypothetical protein
VLEAAEAEQVLGRLDADAHLVAVVGARVREAVHERPDGRAQDQPALGDRARPLAVRLEAVDRVVHAAAHRPLGRWFALTSSSDMAAR